MAAIQISTNAEFIQINTTTNAGTVLLPSAIATAGRILTFKDTAGTFFNRPFTLSTTSTDRFENGANQITLREPFGYLTLASDGINRWFALDGTSLPSYTIPSLTNPIQTSTTNISSSEFTVSTLGFVDRSFNTLSSIYTRSTLLFLGSNVIGGSKCGPTQFISPARSGGFTPLSVTGLNVWLDASDLGSFTLISGNRVSIWGDKSGSSRSATQFATANQPTLSPSVLGGKSCVSFTAATTVMGLPSYGLNLIPPISIFILARQTTLGGEFLGITAGSGIYFRPSNGVSPGPTYVSYGVDYGGNLFRYCAVPANIDTTSFHIQSFALPNNAVGNYWFDGSLGDSATGFTYNSASFQSVLPSIGAYSQTPGNDAMTGFIAEILIYRALLTTLEVQQVEGYLAWKWGVTSNLPSTHPYKNIPP